MRTTLFLPAALLVAAFAAAADDSASRHPPLSARTLATLQATQGQQGTLDAAGEGRRLFLKLNCYSCHGMFAAGGMGPSIVHAERGDVQEAVMQGEDSGMPSFRQYVSQTDINNLATYLGTIGGSNEPKFMDWWKKNPTK